MKKTRKTAKVHRFYMTFAVHLLKIKISVMIHKGMSKRSKIVEEASFL